MPQVSKGVRSVESTIQSKFQEYFRFLENLTGEKATLPKLELVSTSDQTQHIVSEFNSSTNTFKVTLSRYSIRTENLHETLKKFDPTLQHNIFIIHYIMKHKDSEDSMLAFYTGAGAYAFQALATTRGIDDTDQRLNAIAHILLEGPDKKAMDAGLKVVSVVYSVIRRGLELNGDPDIIMGETISAIEEKCRHAIGSQGWDDEKVRSGFIDSLGKAFALLMLMAKFPDYKEAVKELSKPPSDIPWMICQTVSDAEPDRKVRKAITSLRAHFGIESDEFEMIDRLFEAHKNH